jgi:hypothetical protein
LTIDEVDGGDVNTTLSIQLIAQQVWFSEREAFLSWSRFDKDTAVENDSGLRYILYSSNCDVSNNASIVENTTNNYAHLALGDTDDEFYNISAVNGDQRSTINELFRISPGGTMMILIVILIARLIITCSCNKEY